MSEIKKSKSELIIDQLQKAALKRELDDYYYFMHENRGIALIFNHEVFINHTKRIGTRKDGDDLKAALEKLKFDVRDHKDLKLHEIKKILLEVSLEDHSKNDCLLVTVMSHGGKDDKISAADEDYNVEELWKNFLGANCKSLVEKPKIFIIQACRGDKIDFGNVLEPDPSDGVKADSKKVTVRQFADLLVMYSTVDGHYANRNINQGSWFIQALCKELNDESLNYDLMHILTRVNRKVLLKDRSVKSKSIETNQISKIESTLRKYILFFNKSRHSTVIGNSTVSNDAFY